MEVTLLGMVALVAWSISSVRERGVGFSKFFAWSDYALTSCRSVVIYLKLALWPNPLVFDYGLKVIHSVKDAMPYALLLAALLIVVAVLCWHRPTIGFAGAWFFVILCPTSSVIPVALMPTAESRVYLPLAAVVSLGVIGLYSLFGKRSFAVFAALAVGLCWLSIRRNEDYHSEVAIWSDTVAKRPDNARALCYLGYALAKIPGRLPDAVADYRAALEIAPHYLDPHIQLGEILAKIPGRLSEAVTEYEMAIQLEPDNADISMIVLSPFWKSAVHGLTSLLLVVSGPSTFIYLLVWPFACFRREDLARLIPGWRDSAPTLTARAATSATPGTRAAARPCKSSATARAAAARASTTSNCIPRRPPSR
jgi:tetratricopeptide (TPR) repeat protein